MKDFVTSIAFSSTRIRLVSGYVKGGRVFVLKASSSPALPLDKSGMIDKNEGKKALLALKKESLDHLGDLGSLVALLPPIDYVVRREEDTSALVQESISQHDFLNVANMIKNACKTSDHHVLYCDPISFLPEGGKRTASFPLGVKTSSLTMEADMHMISSSAFDYYSSLLSDCGMEPDFYALAPFAQACFFLSFGAKPEYYLLSLEEDSSTLSLILDNHLASSEILPFSLDAFYKKTSEILSLPVTKVQEYAKLFGLRSTAGFPYQTDEGKTLEEISKAFKEALLPWKEEIQKRMKEPSEIQVIFVGEGSSMEGLNTYLSSSLTRTVLLFNGAPLGAREKDELACLGGIRLSSYPYQSHKKENRREETYLSNSKSRFGRGQ